MLGIGRRAERRFLGMRGRDERLSRELARELEGARMVGDLGGQAIARLQMALEPRRGCE